MTDFQTVEIQKKQYIEKNEYLHTCYEKIEPKDFYRGIFPAGSFERKMNYDDQKPNGIILEFQEGKKRAYREIVTDDLEGFLKPREGFTIYSPISYYGRSRKGVNARYLHALAFDIDGVEMKHLIDLLYQMENEVLPTPTYLVNSGTGFHLYYQFEEPIPMYPDNQKFIKDMKRVLTDRIWNQYTSKYKEKQQQGILQGFRVIGTSSKLGKEFPVVAFDVENAYREQGGIWTIDKLLKFIPESRRTPTLLGKKKKTAMTLDKAKEKHPEWYERKVVQGEQRGRWVVKRALYDWWLRLIKDKTEVGHRYFSVMCLAIYAKKCNISEEELYKDGLSLLEPFDDLTKEESNHFLMADIVAALEMYNEDYVTFPRKDIEKLSGIFIPANKRNFRKQEIHMKFMNHQREFKVELGECTNGGRPNKEKEIREWRKQNPNGKKADCIKETGISKPTVYKYWER